MGDIIVQTKAASALWTDGRQPFLYPITEGLPVIHSRCCQE